jgi:hypothetical protein
MSATARTTDRPFDLSSGEDISNIPITLTSRAQAAGTVSNTQGRRSQARP